MIHQQSSFAVCYYNMCARTSYTVLFFFVFLTLVLAAPPDLSDHVNPNCLLIIDEDSINNDKLYGFNGTAIDPNPSGPYKWTACDINDGGSTGCMSPSKTQRNVLKFFRDNVGKTITIQTGQGDENYVPESGYNGDYGWFSLGCLPKRWYSNRSEDSDDNQCLTGSEAQTALTNFWSLQGSPLGPKGSSGSDAMDNDQNRFDKIPYVMPYTNTRLASSMSNTFCAVVYDNDISINKMSPEQNPYIEANLQGETYGVVAFQVTGKHNPQNQTPTPNWGSANTLDHMVIKILDIAVCPSICFLSTTETSGSSGYWDSNSSLLFAAIIWFAVLWY